MYTNELQAKWASLNPISDGSYRSLRISADCIPELYIGLDINGIRCLILQLPSHFGKDLKPVIREHLTLEFFLPTKQLFIKLKTPSFSDLFNDLIMSIYNLIREEIDSTRSSEIIIDNFYRWLEFFDSKDHNGLSEQEVVGMVGELFYLSREIDDANDSEVNDMLNAWKGPFDGGHDFEFGNRRVEIKTRHQNSNDIRISSEFQLHSEPGMPLELVVISVVSDNFGDSLLSLTNRLRNQITSRLGDLSILHKALKRKGLTALTLPEYEHHKFQIVAMVGYDCMQAGFPKITPETKHPLLSRITYCIRITEMNEFITRNFEI